MEWEHRQIFGKQVPMRAIAGQRRVHSFRKKALRAAGAQCGSGLLLPELGDQGDHAECADEEGGSARFRHLAGAEAAAAGFSGGIADEEQERSARHDQVFRKVFHLLPLFSLSDIPHMVNNVAPLATIVSFLHHVSQDVLTIIIFYQEDC
nr:hypothetical protein [Massilia sp. 9I]